MRILAIGREFRGSGQEKMMQAAELLDNEHGTMTMTMEKFLTHLKQQNLHVRRRATREREDDYDLGREVGIRQEEEKE
eukprot:6996409-Ditylum_brightwellii.AAC.1